MEKPFSDRDYTEDSLVKQWALVELHAKDGSAILGGCSCIEGKHLFAIEGLSEEGQGFALSSEERDFYINLGDVARKYRNAVIEGNWKYRPSNPGTREFLPHGLTEHEEKSPHLQRKLSLCIKRAELRCCGVHTTDYSGCSCNPIAICRASIKH